MSIVQKIFDGLKSVVPRRKASTYTMSFLWQISPAVLVAAIYYTSIEYL